MRRIKTIILFTAFCLSSLWVKSFQLNAEEIQQSVILTEQRNQHQERPQKPSRQRIICMYSRGYMELDFSFTGYLDVTISKDEIPVWSGTVTQDSPSADIPVLYGEHTITCITDGGQIFTGNLNF